MGRPTENSVAGGLIILASTIGGAVLLAVVGCVAMLFVAEWLWVPPAGPNMSKGVDGAIWGGFFVPEWLWHLSVRPFPEPGKGSINFAKGIYVATYALGGGLGGFALGAATGALLPLRCLSRAKDH